MAVMVDRLWLTLGTWMPFLSPVFRTSHPQITNAVAWLFHIRTPYRPTRRQFAMCSRHHRKTVANFSYHPLELVRPPGVQIFYFCCSVLYPPAAVVVTGKWASLVGTFMHIMVDSDTANEHDGHQHIAIGTRRKALGDTLFLLLYDSWIGHVPPSVHWQLWVAC